MLLSEPFGTLTAEYSRPETLRKIHSREQISIVARNALHAKLHAKIWIVSCTIIIACNIFLINASLRFFVSLFSFLLFRSEGTRGGWKRKDRKRDIIVTASVKTLMLTDREARRELDSLRCK